MAFTVQQIDVINDFSHALDMCRSQLITCEIHKEKSYEYAIARAYSRTLLTACEVNALIREGYPEGALSLARSLFEALVIISKLLQGLKDNDEEMLERFFLSPQLFQIQYDIKSAEWILSVAPDDALAKDILEKKQIELKKLKEEHGITTKQMDYWWANAETFAQLARTTSFPKNSMYMRACANVHFNATGILQYIDDSDEEILIGSTDKGIELPLWYSALHICAIGMIIHKEYPNMVSAEAVTAMKNVEETASKLRRGIINPNLSSEISEKN